MNEPCPHLTDSEAELAFRKGTTDEEIEVALRHLFLWSYIVRDPLGRVCALGRGTRADCMQNALVDADEYATESLSQLEEEADEIRAFNGPWRIALWPPRFDADPRFWAASSNIFDEC